MRRVAFPLAAILLSAALPGCGAGGQALSFTAKPPADHVILSVAGSTNLPRVLPGAAIVIAAMAVSGAQNGTVATDSYRWNAVLSGGQYASSSGAMKPCGSISITNGGTVSPYPTDFSLYLTIDPTNESNVEFIPPTIVAPPSGGAVTVTYPYCVTVTATVRTSTNPANQTYGASGSITVVVVDPLNPVP